MALALVAGQVHGPAALGRRQRLQVELQQPLVNGAQVADGQVAVVHELAVHAGELIDGLLQVVVADAMAVQEAVPGRIEQAESTMRAYLKAACLQVRRLG